MIFKTCFFGKSPFASGKIAFERFLTMKRVEMTLQIAVLAETSSALRTLIFLLFRVNRGDVALKTALGDERFLAVDTDV